MHARGWFPSLFLILVVAALAVDLRGQIGGAGGGGGGGPDPTALRRVILSRYQQSVGFTDEEWTVIEPRLWRILALQIDTGGGAAGSLFRNRGRSGGAGTGSRSARLQNTINQLFNEGQPSAVAAARQQLNEAITDSNTTLPQLRTRLEDYRAAVSDARQQLMEAQADLRGLVTIRQEACLVSAGFLE